jgi:hypothetical protein
MRVAQSENGRRPFPLREERVRVRKNVRHYLNAGKRAAADSAGFQTGLSEWSVERINKIQLF